MKRRLERIENTFGSDLTCTVQCGSETFECGVADYNALGFRISCTEPQQFEKISREEIQSAQIRYGNYVLGFLTFPDISRATTTHGDLILVPSQKSRIQVVDRPLRADVPVLFEPVLVGPDPIKMREKLVFRVENISARGFRAKCSLSNRHLLPGQHLKDFSILIPTMGEFNCSFVIGNARVDRDFLILGCEFSGLTEKLAATIGDFLLLCSLSHKSADVSPKLEHLPKKTSSILRLRRIDQSREMDKVLALRFSAYQGAHKLIPNAKISDMRDEHDQNAIVIGAFIGLHMVGTVRVVFSRGGSPFPFEKHFAFPETKALTRENCVELSKMAVATDLQGSDIVFRLLQAAAFEFISKCDYALLMSTKTLAKNYVSIGAEKLSENVPHPVVTGEIMNLYLFDNEKLKTGKMSALSWLFFAREIIDFVARFGFHAKTKPPVFKLLKAPIELASKRFKKFRARKSA